MNFRKIGLRVGVVGVGLSLSLPGLSAALSAPELAPPAGLSIAEIKVTGDEFVVLQNNSDSDITDLGSYALDYFNNFNPFAGGVSSSMAFLPSTTLAAGDSLMLSGQPRQTCGAAVAGDLGLSLGDSSGFLEIVKLSSDNGSVVQQAGDVVSWSSSANGLIQNMPSSSKDPAAMYYRYRTDTGYSWQYADIDSANPCQLNAVFISGTTKTTAPTDGQLVSDNDSIPGTIISLAGGPIVTSDGSAGLPVADIGLKSPKISELLPDPVAPASDASDEFIELYNPNTRPFDLAGFTLQAGSTTSETRHNYTFSAGTTIPAGGFKAFYSSQTHINLSNTGGQAWLLDPFGTSIAQSDPYSKPKAGNSWAAVGSHWYYTTSPTPGAANGIIQPSATSAKSASTKAKTSKGAVVTALKGSGSVAGDSTTNTADAISPSSPIHPLTLAIVLGLALLYGAYEYRHDLANRFQQLRGHRKAGP